MSILKSCPSCGGKATVEDYPVEEYSCRYVKRVGCNNNKCLLRPNTRHYVRLCDAIKAWNTRTLDKAIEKACDEGEIEKFACKLIAKHCDECVGTDSKCPVSTAISNHIRSVFAGGGE